VSAKILRAALLRQADSGAVSSSPIRFAPGPLTIFQQAWLPYYRVHSTVQRLPGLFPYAYMACT